MQSKIDLLNEIKSALLAGTIEPADLQALIGEATQPVSSNVSVSTNKISLFQGLFYVAGIILFAAVLSVMAQTWDGGTALHISLTLVMGSALWMVAYLVGNRQAGEVQRGMAEALILTGSLLIITGGYVVINLFGDYGTVDFIEASFMAVVLAAVHIGFWRIIKRDLPYLLGILLFVTAVGAVIFHLLAELDAAGDIWALALIGLLGLLAWANRVASRLSDATKHLAGAYDSLAIVVGLVVMYIASFGDWAGLWYLALAGAIVGVYYRSVVARQRMLLGTASTFLVLLSITLSFRYFSAFGVTVSLVLSALAILGVAMLATRLSKKYLSPG